MEIGKKILNKVHSEISVTLKSIRDYISSCEASDDRYRDVVVSKYHGDLNNEENEAYKKCLIGVITGNTEPQIEVIRISAGKNLKFLKKVVIALLKRTISEANLQEYLNIRVRTESETTTLYIGRRTANAD